jgi:undecaprenyl diphosphate synthase
MAKTKTPFKANSPEAALWEQIDTSTLPGHIAIIMDGNGRWAQQRGKVRIAGHRSGVQATRRIVKACAKIGVSHLTLYAFSLDNWKRPAEEVDFLMGLLRQYVRRELSYMKRNNVRLRVIGRWRELPQEVVRDIARTMEETRENTGLEVTVALNYTGRAEIVDAVREILAQKKEGDDASLSEEDVARRLYAPDLPDPDLLIRTSGEERVSNFLLWQIAYTEFWVTDTLWPDFDALHLLEAIRDFQQRERRYGGISSTEETTDSTRTVLKD